MAYKCIGIGNRIMGDDSIGVKVVEYISSHLAKEKVEVIIGETDIDYTLSCIKDEDFLFIVDSTYFNKIPGTVTFISLSKVGPCNELFFSQHQANLISLLKSYHPSIKGYIIGIEVEQVGFGLELSEKLEANFARICKEVNCFICKVKWNLESCKSTRDTEHLNCPQIK